MNFVAAVILRFMCFTPARIVVNANFNAHSVFGFGRDTLQQAGSLCRWRHGCGRPKQQNKRAAILAGNQAAI
jgi:hypothetical protein